MTNDKRNPPKTEKCPTCGGEAKLDERRYTEQDQVAYSCRNGLSHYFFDTDPHLEVRRLRSELDRARKVVEAARNLRQFSMGKTEDLIGNLRLWVELEGALDAALSAYDVPTENK